LRAKFTSGLKRRRKRGGGGGMEEGGRDREGGSHTGRGEGELQKEKKRTERGLNLS